MLILVVMLLVGVLIGGGCGSWYGYKFGVLRAALDLLPPGESYRAVGVQVTNCERLPDDGDAR